MFLPNTIFAIALLLWALCFRDAWRNKTPHALFGSARNARRFWVAMLLLFNPILVVAYAVFARFGRMGKLHSGLRHAIVLSVAVFAIWMQLGGPGTPRTMGDVKEQLPTTGWGLNISRTTLERSSSYQTMTNGGSLKAPRSLRVLYSDDEISRACAHRLAEDLMGEWWTDKVELWPRGEPLEDGGLAPDFIINISTEDVTGWPMPLFQTIQGRLLVTGSCSSYPMGSMSAYERIPLIGAIEISSDISFKFQRTGAALGSSVIGGLADGLNSDVRELVTEDFRGAAASGHRMELRPSELQPRRIEVPAPLAALDLQTLGREHGSFVHERAWFRFRAEGRSEQVLQELNDALEAQGWNPFWDGIQEGESSVLRMDRGSLQVTVGRWPRPEPQGTTWINGVLQESNEPLSDSPFIVTLVSYFTDSEYEALADTYATDPVDVQALLAMQSKIKAPGPLDILRKALRADPSPEVFFWLTIARLDRRAEDFHAEKEAVGVAYALAKTTTGYSEKSSVESYAKSRELELPPASDPADSNALVRAGFHSISQETGTVTLSLELHEQTYFLRPQSGAKPSLLLVRVNSLTGETAIHIEYHSQSMGQRIKLPVGTGWAWGQEDSSSSFKLESELRDGKVEFRVFAGPPSAPLSGHKGLTEK